MLSASEAVDVRSAGVGQAHYLGAFVECFACGVVDGAAENLHVVVASYEDYLRVAAGYKQAQVRELGHTVVGVLPYELCQHVAVEVVDVDNRYAQTERHALGEACTH